MEIWSCYYHVNIKTRLSALLNNIFGVLSEKPKKFDVHGSYHEFPWFIPLLYDIPIPLDGVCSNKGFDSEKNQGYVVVKRNAHSYVDIKGKSKRGRYRKQTYRKKQQYPNQWNSVYRQMRNCIESKNSTVKHRFGDFIPEKTSITDIDVSLSAFLQQTSL